MPVKQLFASILNNKGEGRQFIHEAEDFVVFLPAVYKIAKALGVPVTELIEDVPEELPPTTKKPKKVAEDTDTYPTEGRR
ncbi:MAG TPA: hypothetical protein VKB35_17400 [Ktedonobacteraceae bacterium]|nr:hypothetical protein [Ktedonobacteraceae bacterium]